MATAVELARARIQAFADRHGVVFEDHGEVGFGRPCVGLRYGNNYIAYHPTQYVYTSPFDINISDIVLAPGFEGDEVLPPDSVDDAYHKDDCIAVLARNYDSHDEVNYDAAILQLADWVASLERYDVEIVGYFTGAQGLQLLVSGAIGRAIRVKRPS